MFKSDDKMNKNDAVNKMVGLMTAVPYSVLSKFQRIYYETGDEEFEVREVTPRNKDLRERCGMYGSNDCDGCDGFNNDSDYNDIDEYFKDYTPCSECVTGYELEDYDSLPMWGTLWALEPIDQEKIDRDPEFLKGLAKIGFRIYDTYDYGYVIGIDGAGFSFYDHYWLPLYNLLNLRWHDAPYKWEEVHTDKDGNRIYNEEDMNLIIKEE